MITGDSKLTAEAIGREIGLIKPSDDLKNCSFQTSDFFKLSEKEQEDILGHTNSLIFSRSNPEHKMNLVTILKKLVSILYNFRNI